MTALSEVSLETNQSDLDKAKRVTLTGGWSYCIKKTILYIASLGSAAGLFFLLTVGESDPSKALFFVFGYGLGFKEIAIIVLNMLVVVGIAVAHDYSMSTNLRNEARGKKGGYMGTINWVIIVIYLIFSIVGTIGLYKVLSADKHKQSVENSFIFQQFEDIVGVAKQNAAALESSRQHFESRGNHQTRTSDLALAGSNSINESMNALNSMVNVYQSGIGAGGVAKLNSGWMVITAIILISLLLELCIFALTGNRIYREVEVNEGRQFDVKESRKKKSYHGNMSEESLDGPGMHSSDLPTFGGNEDKPSNVYNLPQRPLT